MKNKILRFFLVAVISIMMQPLYASCNNLNEKQIQNIIDKDRKIFEIPGIEISIVCPNESKTHTFVSGTTKINNNRKIQPNNLFQVGSETKSFVAALILQLEAEGKLSIQDKIEKWLPNIPVHWHGITIQQLLNQTSGIYDYSDTLIEMFRHNQIDFQKVWQPMELVNLIAEKPLDFPPGSSWEYSNTNFILAGLIIEAATHHSLVYEFNKRFIIPLKLKNTYYVPGFYSNSVLQRMAHGYSKSGVFLDEPKDITDTNTSWAGASGAMTSNSNDMSIWIKQLLAGNVLPKKQLAELLSLVDQKTGKPISDSVKTPGYSLAIFHDFTNFNEETWWHSGGMLGYSAFMIWLKESNIFITVSGSDYTSDTPTKRDLYYLTKDVITYLQK